MRLLPKKYLLLKSHRWYFIFEQVQYIIVLTIDFDSNLLEFLGDKYCDLYLTDRIIFSHEKLIFCRLFRKNYFLLWMDKYFKLSFLPLHSPGGFSVPFLLATNASK